MARLEASVSLSPDDDIGLEDSRPVTMRLCLGFRPVGNKGLGPSGLERGSLVVLAPAQGGYPRCEQHLTSRRDARRSEQQGHREHTWTWRTRTHRSEGAHAHA